MEGYWLLLSLALLRYFLSGLGRYLRSNECAMPGKSPVRAWTWELAAPKKSGPDGAECAPKQTSWTCWKPNLAKQQAISGMCTEEPQRAVVEWLAVTGPR